MIQDIGKRWTFGCYAADKQGTKQFGVALWGNDARVGLQINFWRWEMQIMREHKR